MKRYFSVLFLMIILLSLKTNISFSQCPGGYTQAQLNWDNLDYYFNGSQYGSYINDAREQTQKFAIGTTWLTIATSSANLVQTTENTTHTGDITGYTGQDLQYTAVTAATITITFSTPVLNASFALYDIDRSAVFNVTAADPASGALAVTATREATTILSVTGTTGKTITANSTTLGTIAENRGTVTIAVAGSVSNPVKSITITCTTVGSDADFWLSDINACVASTFPTNWHQGFSNRPFVGPTQNQPDYFLVTPDNNSCYMMDPATGNCYWLFTDLSKTYMNSFAYDPQNKILYYISENSSLDVNNKALKKYDFNTETPSTIVANIGTTLGIPTFNSGVESAAAAFYNGKIYLGIEGGRSGTGGSTVTRETIVWGINLDASQNPVSAYQVFATNAYKDATDSSMHDWADIIIRDGELFSFNTARMGPTGGPYTYNRSAYHHYNMMTGNLDAYYQNPDYNATFTGQAGMNWAGQLYFVRDSVGLYNENGTNSATRYKAVVQNVPGDPVPPAWVASAGDASDPFRPKCDFGDAPDSYDPYITPATQSPAVHERSELIRLGATWDKEFWKRGTAGTDDIDDGLPYVPIMAPGGGGYVVRVTAFNNSGADATLIAWLDINGNGTFDAGEAVTPVTVPTSASSQNFWLYWYNTNNSFTSGQSTYLRIRITSAAAGMTTSHATGYFTNGEVEDYRVLIDNYPLASQLLNFDASVQGRNVRLKWNVAEELGTYAYVVERSSNNINWQGIDTVDAHNSNGTFDYETADFNPLKGNSYYRLRIIESTGMERLSQVKRVTIKDVSAGIILLPNPAKDKLTVQLDAGGVSSGNISLLNMNGQTIISSDQKFNSGINSIAIGLPSSISNGTYVVKIVIGTEVIYKKAIIHK